jgi:hypothetical protein
MSVLSVVPDLVTGASGNLQNLGSALQSANAAAASQTTAITAPAADEVSAATAALLNTRGQEFQVLSAKAAAFHDEFVNLLSGGAAQYVSAEAANVQQTLANTVNAPAQALLGHPLIGAGQGTAGAAAATPAQPVQGITQSFNVPVDPLQISLNQTSFPDFTGGLSLLGVSNAAVTLNTPFGLVSLLSGNGTEFVSSTGPFALSINETTPFYTVGESLSGILPSGGTGVPQITGFSFDLDGFGFSI